MKRMKISKVALITMMMTSLLAPLDVTLASNGSTTLQEGSKAIQFVDLQQVSPTQRTQIQRAVELGLIHGDGTGHYHPEEHLTRQEMAVLLTQALQLPLKSPSSSFVDVDAKGWSSRYIEAVRAAGLMQGDGNAHFHPNDLITRQEMAVVLMRAAQLPLDTNTSSSAPSADWTGIGAWAKPYVQTALKTGAMENVGNAFSPTVAVNRADVAQMVNETFFPEDRTSQLQGITGDHVQINGVKYQVAKSLQGLLRENNNAILKGAQVKFESTNRTIDRITSLEIRSNGTLAKDGEAEFSRNLVLDGAGATIDGDLVLAGDFLSVANLTVAGNFRIGKELQNDFHASDLTVKGTTTVAGGDENTVVFQDSSLQTVDVSKEDVHIVSQGTTSATSINVTTNATIETDRTAQVPQVTLADGAKQVTLQGTMQQVLVTSTSPITISGSAQVANLTVNSAAAVSLNSTGTVGTLQVNDPGAKVAVSGTTNVAQVSLAAGVPSGSVSGVTVASPTPAPNTPPRQTTPIVDQIVTLGDANTTIDLSNYFTDDEQTTLKYSVNVSPKNIVNKSVVGNILTLTPTGRGVATVSMLIDDQYGKYITSSFKITVNAPPTSTGISDQSIALHSGDVTLPLNTYFTDPDTDALTYTVTLDDPSLASSQVDNGTLTLSPAKTGSSLVHVTASDNRGGTHTESFLLTVTAALNQDPVKTSIAPMALTVGKPDGTVDLSTVFSDPDQDTLTYEVTSSKPDVATVDVNSSTLTVHPVASGTSTVQVTARDGKGGEALVSFDVTVNAPPKITTISDQSLQMGSADTQLDLSSYLSDTEGDVLTVTANSDDTTIATVQASGQTLTLSPAKVGQTHVNVTVDDSHGGVTTSSFAVTVTAAPNNGGGGGGGGTGGGGGNTGSNTAPEVDATIYEQVLTPGVTNARTYDLSQLFSDQDGDALTYTVVSDDETAAHAEVNGSSLTLTPGSGTGSTTVTVTANDGHGGTKSYPFTVRTAPLVNSGLITVRAKQGINGITYDLSDLFPGQTSFTTYMGTADSTFTGPTPLNGTGVSLDGTTGMYVWVIGADGKAAVFQLVSTPQGDPTLYFSQYFDNGDGRIAFQIDDKNNSYCDPQHPDMSYVIEVHQWNVKTNTPIVFNQQVWYGGQPFVVIDSIFYDYMDLTNAPYYNAEFRMYNPGEYVTVGLVLKQNDQVVDVLGDPNSHTQFLPNGGTLMRKSGIFTGSSSYSQAGEWNLLPRDSYQYITHYMP